MQGKMIVPLLYDKKIDTICFDGSTLHCGDCLEVLVCNGLNGGEPE